MDRRRCSAIIRNSLEADVPGEHDAGALETRSSRSVHSLPWPFAPPPPPPPPPRSRLQLPPLLLLLLPLSPGPKGLGDEPLNGERPKAPRPWDGDRPQLMWRVCLCVGGERRDGMRMKLRWAAAAWRFRYACAEK